jgi:hypothetical protein
MVVERKFWIAAASGDQWDFAFPLLAALWSPPAWPMRLTYG